MLRLRLLGSPEVETATGPARFDTRKALALLALLAVEGRAQPRDRLAAMLWPDADSTRARSALRRTLSVTSSGVGAGLVVDRSSVRLDPAAVSSDVAEFRAAAGAEPPRLAEAVALYRDDFLTGFRLRDAPEFDDWQDAVADGLRRELADVLRRLVESTTDAGDLDTAAAYGERWLRLDPLHEPAHQALIRLQAWRGDRAAAMRQYRRCLRILDTELGVPPLAETTALYDAVRRNELPEPPRPAEPAASEPAARPAAPFVGRDDALAALRRLVDTGAGVGVVSGGPGTGKSTLLRALVAALPATSAAVDVRAHPEETALAYGVAIDLLRALVAARPAAVESLGRHSRADLARLLPELGSTDSDRGAPAPTARLYAAVLELVAGSGNAVVTVDDAQWLDPASAELLAYLLRRIDHVRLVLIATWAEDSPPGPLFRAAADLVLDGRGTRQRLTALTEPDIETLAAAYGVADADVPAIREQTGGVPGLVASYLDAVRDGQDPALGAAALRTALAERVGDLSETAQQVLAAAAVAGARADADVLRETSGRTDTEVVTAVEEALRAGLLVEVGATGYDVAVESLRGVIVDRLTAARRRLLHQRTAAALERRAGARLTPAVAGAIARHLAAAGRDEEAADWHWRAATLGANLQASAEALTATRAALALGRDPAEARRLEGQLLIALGRYREATEALELAAATQPDDRALVDVERLLADVHHRIGDYPIADSHVVTALALLEPGTPDNAALRAELYAERAVLARRTGDRATAADLANTALELAAAARDDGATSYAENVIGLLAADAGELDDAADVFRRAVEHAERGANPGRQVAALNNLARVLHRAGERESALAVAEDALQRGERFGDLHRVAALHANLADQLRAVGRDEEAMAELKQSVALFAGVDDPGDRRPEIWTLVEW